jgi:hypothetical protein
MLVCHKTSDEIGILITLRTAPKSPGMALDQATLRLAMKSDSDAVTGLCLSAPPCLNPEP